jgi:hypothetical protein
MMNLNLLTQFIPIFIAMVAVRIPSLVIVINVLFALIMISVLHVMKRRSMSMLLPKWLHQAPLLVSIQE